MPLIPICTAMLKSMQRDAILLSLMNEMRENGSWCGETHIQKSVYFLQELLQVPMGHDYILYKHGPYSFDLADAVTALRADSLLEYKSRRPYGPSLIPTKTGQDFLNRYPKTLAKYADRLQFIAGKMGRMGVAELERQATALFVILNEKCKEDSRASKIIELKPHIQIDQAEKALESIEAMIKEACEKGLCGRTLT